MSPRDLTHYLLTALIPVVSAGVLAFGPVMGAADEVEPPPRAVGETSCGPSDTL